MAKWRVNEETRPTCNIHIIADRIELKHQRTIEKKHGLAQELIPQSLNQLIQSLTLLLRKLFI